MDAATRKIYFAGRILPNADPETSLMVNSSMTVSEVTNAYINKVLNKGSYIHNGHWILRNICSENSFENNNIPKAISPADIWDMVRQKIETSDAVLAIINTRAHGTIAEAGYAARSGKVAVYLLPDQDMKDGDLQDFWLVFQIACSTKHLWKQEDIENIPHFKKYDIRSITDYSNFVANIIPNFLKK